MFSTVRSNSSIIIIKNVMCLKERRQATKEKKLKSDHRYETLLLYFINEGCHFEYDFFFFLSVGFFLILTLHVKHLINDYERSLVSVRGN